MSSITYLDDDGDWAWYESVVIYNRYSRFSDKPAHIISRHYTASRAYRRSVLVAKRLTKSRITLSEAKDGE